MTQKSLTVTTEDPSRSGGIEKLGLSKTAYTGVYTMAQSLIPSKIWQTFFSYDTSSIPDDATLESATFSFYVNMITSSGSPGIKWDVYAGSDIIGATLDTLDWNFPLGTKVGNVVPTSNTTFNISISDLSLLSKTGFSEFHLKDMSTLGLMDSYSTSVNSARTKLSVTYSIGMPGYVYNFGG